MRAADAVVTLNQSMRQELLERGVPEDRITVVPNAVDTQRFAPRPPDPELLERLGIRDGQLVIGYIGALQPYEGLPTLVGAVAELVRRGRDVRLLIVGDGSAAESIRARVDAHGLGHRVTMQGTVPHDDVQRWYSVMAIVVNARTNDRVSRIVAPTKPLEALAMERALVVSRTPALLECIVEGRTGLAVTPDSISDLAMTLDRLIGEPELRESLGREARAWVIGERSWAANGDAYRGLFRRLGLR